MNIDIIIKNMTLKEKAALCSGADFWHTKEIERLGVPDLAMSDGPHGLRKQTETQDGDHLGLNDSVEAVCFPAACATASSFDRELMNYMGKLLGKECRAEHVSVLLGPAVNIKRSPLCGRNFEYMSEDPYLTGELAAAYIEGVQSENTGTSIKHFAANNQEHERMSVSAEVDERTMREIYLPAFEMAVKKAKPWTVMCSYNKINGTYASEDAWLLTDILRKEWGFDGFVMSDWGAVRDRVSGLDAGMDLEMPGSRGTNDEAIVRAVEEGRMQEEVLDRAVRRILRIVYRSREKKVEAPVVFDRERDHDAAAEIAKECIVLLKNDKAVLPLSQDEKVVFVGEFAEKPRYQGGGSSHIHSHRVETALRLKDDYGQIRYAKGFSSDEDIADAKLEEEALSAAEEADKVVVFAGLPDVFESEGYDREHMKLPKCQDRLIEKLSASGKPVIVVLHNGAPVEMPWIGSVQGVLEAYLGGEGIGKAVMDILYGKANPCGRLAETFPRRLEDNPSYLNFPGMDKKVSYAEGIFVGYRYYDKKKMDVLFPFGHGLSYTTFEYSNLKLSRIEMTPQDTVRVSLDITNTGKMEGKEIVQLYIADQTERAVRPERELKNFAAVRLKPGETKQAVMELDYRSLAWYDQHSRRWRACSGKYRIMIGRSSRDIVLSEVLQLKGGDDGELQADRNMMIGDLLRGGRTRDYVKERLLPYISQFAGTDQLDEMDLMQQKMVYYMPLSSLRSFSDLTNEDLDVMEQEIKKL